MVGGRVVVALPCAVDGWRGEVRTKMLPSVFNHSLSKVTRDKISDHLKGNHLKVFKVLIETFPLSYVNILSTQLIASIASSTSTGTCTRISAHDDEARLGLCKSHPIVLTAALGCRSRLLLCVLNAWQIVFLQLIHSLIGRMLSCSALLLCLEGGVLRVRPLGHPAMCCCHYNYCHYMHTTNSATRWLKFVLLHRTTVPCNLATFR